MLEVLAVLHQLAKRSLAEMVEPQRSREKAVAAGVLVVLLQAAQQVARLMAIASSHLQH
jgi:hypothetical protein